MMSRDEKKREEKYKEEKKEGILLVGGDQI